MTPLITHPNAFPTSPPPDLDDPSVVAAHDWKAFGGITEMRDHWQRPGWSSDTRAYYWLLTISDPAFAAQARHCQDAVRHLNAFDLIDQDGFHLTLGRIALTDSVEKHHLQRLAETIQADAPQAFELSAVPLAGSPGALRYSVAPWTPLITLHQQLAGASAAITSLPAMKASNRLRPHVGIGYCNRTLATPRVHTAISPLRLLPPIALLIDRLDLVEMRREATAYKWRIIQTVRLLSNSHHSRL